ncbi:MAG: glycosyltransferase [Candidatus Hodarchaeota archaeon]
MDQKISLFRRLSAKIFIITTYLLTGFTILYISWSLILIFRSNQLVTIIFNCCILIGEAIGLSFAVYLFALLALSLRKPLKEPTFDYSFIPTVTVILPIFNEHHDVFHQTLDATIKLDYPPNKLEIIVVDDSTQLTQAKKTKKLCKTLGVKYKHRDNRKGFKAGAINSVLEETKGDFLVILDADQIPFPYLLKSIIPHFIDEKVALVQAKLSFRNLDCVTRKCAALVHTEFYEVFERAKDHIGTASFSGTTGAFRKTALLEIGGISEETIVEDADTAFKLLARGYQGRLADTYGSIGLTPWHFSSHIAQLWRMAQGTTAVLRKRTGLILQSDLPFFTKLDLLLSLAVTPASVSIILVATILSVMTIIEIPLIRLGGSLPLYLIMPTSVMLAHLLSAVLALKWGKQEKVPSHSIWEIVPFNIFSLMVLPFLISAVIAGLKGKRSVFQRTEKLIPGNQAIQEGKRPITAENVFYSSVLVFLFGLFLIFCGFLAFLQNNLFYGLLISVGLCFLIPLPLLLNDYRIYGTKKVAEAT